MESSKGNASKDKLKLEGTISKLRSECRELAVVERPHLATKPTQASNSPAPRLLLFVSAAARTTCGCQTEDASLRKMRGLHSALIVRQQLAQREEESSARLSLKEGLLAARLQGIDSSSLTRNSTTAKATAVHVTNIVNTAARDLTQLTNTTTDCIGVASASYCDSSGIRHRTIEITTGYRIVDVSARQC